MRRGDVVWRPDDEAWDATPIGGYLRHLRDAGVGDFTDYNSLHAWSIGNLSDFWGSVWDFYDLSSHSPFQPGLADPRMPGSVWFPGATLNYAEHALRTERTGVAVIEYSQTRERRTLSWTQLRAVVARVQAALARAGVVRGDTVAVFCPPISEAVIVYLACAGLGAIYSSCAVEFGPQAVLSRLRQIRPKVLFAVDGYRYGSHAVARLDELAQLRHGIDGLEQIVVISYLADTAALPTWAVPWNDFTDIAADEPTFVPVPFDHPLVVVYSSGTTGPPKAIVHSHGGVLIEHVKSLGLHLGLDSTQRFFWYTTAGWMMWNYLISGLLVGASIVLYDGDPAFPDPGVLWRMARDEQVTVFGVSPRFLQMTRRSGNRDMLSAQSIHHVGSTGSPLALEDYAWFYEEAGMQAALVSASGGTDVLSGLVVGCPIVPVYAGEISCAALGVDVDVIDQGGQSVTDRQGELVVRQPMPSMPSQLWNEPDGQRLFQTYFAANPDLWTQGDWALRTNRGSFVLLGRSDATLNRGGVRVGTAEIYAVAEAFEGVADSVAVCLEATADHPDLVLLLVVVDDGYQFDADAATRMSASIRSQLSPRHVPDRIVAIPDIPRTASGKKSELAIKRMLQGREGERNTAEDPQVSTALRASLGRLRSELAM
jgi:acetoacetyl-CoA synthetase